MKFRVVLDPSTEDVRSLEASDHSNPFATSAYATARRALGARVVLFAQGSVCALGYLSGRSFRKSLEIPSAPADIRATTFWDGVLEFCRRHSVAKVEVGSFGAHSVALPAWSRPTALVERTEWIVDLPRADAASFSSNHRRNINKARRLGVVTTSTTDPAAANTHVRLMAASMRRRSMRGETVTAVLEDHTQYESAFLAAGVARIYQALHQGEVVSSLLVLGAATGAYYQSAGTTPEGMDSGASTMLVSETIRMLEVDGKTVFNLGGAGAESEGLQRFKSGFGARPVPLAAGAYELASPVHKTFLTAIRWLGSR